MSYAAHVEVLFSPKYCDAFIIAVDIYDGFRFFNNNVVPGNHKNQTETFVLIFFFVVYQSATEGEL